MEHVYEMLKTADLTTETLEFPLFRIISVVLEGKEKTRGWRVRGITVENWNQEENRELRRPSFITISHVWLQGMGNKSANKLQECQLKFI